MSIETSIIIDFGETVAGSGALAKMELDGAMNLDAAGQEKTSFAPGDTIHFLIHYESTLRLTRVAATSGQIAAQPDVTRQRSEELLFVDADATNELSYNPAGPVAAQWYGNEAIGLKKTETRVMQISGGALPALCNATYTVNFTAYKLVTAPRDLAEGETYPIRIVAWLETITS